MQLPVLTSRPAHAHPGSVLGALPAGGPELSDAQAQELRGSVRGEVKLGGHDRQLYSTDASIYQVMPLGVVVPADEADAQRAVEFCDRHAVALLARGGGTSLAGQCTARALVMDVSSRLLAIGPVTRASDGTGACRAQAGVTLDELNSHLARERTGLFFAPDPSTTAQATIGGCIGNNAAGSRSVKYGRTVDSIVTIDALTSTGHALTLGPGAGGRDPVALKLADGVIGVVKRYERLIRERYPKTLRRNAGYALDLILAQLDRGVTAHELDLTKLLCGSEGTLAVTLAAQVRLLPVPRAKGLALVSFASVDGAIEAVPSILTSGPSAVELVDDVVIEAALNNIECRAYVGAFPPPPGGAGVGDIKGVLYVEYHEGSEGELAQKLAQLRGLLPARCAVRDVTDAKGMADAWKLRKAGEPLLHGLPGSRKPLTFVEDNAVPPEKLGEFVRAFRRLVEREGTRAAFWAHASVGVLHVRPLLDPNNPADMAALKRIAVEAADLAKACGGVMSGEHGDGKVRGPLLERFYGPELMGAFREVKALFDPKGLFNPGNITAPGSIDSILERTRSEPVPGQRPHVPRVATYFTYEDHDGFGHAVERCNGSGVCRKQSGGTMCPSYRGTMQERHSTRGRGNALRLAITGQLPAGGGAGAETGGEAGGPSWDDPETIKTLDLCLSCKACKSECPSNVDIARLKAEYTAQRYKVQGRVPISAVATGYVRVLNRLGSLVPGLANTVNKTRLARAVINRVLKVHPQRTLPAFSPSLYRVVGRGGGDASRPPDRVPVQAPRVAVFADCFTTYNESAIGLATVRVLRELGYHVELPGSNWRGGCCGRSMISVGMLPQAIETIDATIQVLRPLIDDDQVRAIVFAEPSCLSAVKDDWLQLNCQTPLEVRQRLAAKSFLVEDFVDASWDQHPQREGLERALVAASAQAAQGRGVMLHAHCHQKALWGAGTSARLLTRLFGPALSTPDTGCCGMAGSFGYDRDKFDLSMTIGNLPRTGVLTVARQTPAEATICATGTSCRHQIKDGAARHSVHPIELLWELMSGAGSGPQDGRGSGLGPR
jgi:FAD/FMN-containing dehydrogenase/Fe-S oxidoreductase